MPAGSEVTGQFLVDAARCRADMVENDFRSPGDWYRFVSAGWAKVYRRIVVKGGDEFLDGPRPITTANGVDAYDLPFDCMQVKGVDFYVSATESRSMELFSWDRRNRWKESGSWSSEEPVAYRLRGQKIVFRPIPSGIYT